MLFKNKKYTQGMKDGAEPFKKVLEDTKVSKQDFRRSVEILGEKKAQKLLKIYPVKITIVYADKAGKEDKKLAEDISKTLRKGKFDSRTCTYSSLQQCGTEGAVYVIFVGDLENLLQNPSKKTAYHNNYGCDIYKINDSFVLSLSECYSQSGLLEEYEKVMNELRTRDEDLKKALSKKQAAHKYADDTWYEKSLSKCVDFGENHLLLASIWFLCGIAAIPLGILEGIYRVISGALREGNADKEIVALAQRQICFAKMVELMELERENLLRGKA